MDTLNYLVARIPEELARLQNQVDAPADTAIGSMTLTVDTKAEVSRAATIRMVIAALVVGLVGTGACRIFRGCPRPASPTACLRHVGPDLDLQPEPEPEPGRGRGLGGRHERGETAAGTPTDADAPDEVPAPPFAAASTRADVATEAPASTGVFGDGSMSPLSERAPAGRRT